LPLAREDYRLSQFHRLCLQAKALMQWVYSPGTIGIAVASIIIVSDAERLF
jgi:hypothetical protein